MYINDLARKRDAPKEDNLSPLGALAVRIYIISLSRYVSIYLSIYLCILYAYSDLCI